MPPSCRTGSRMQAAMQDPSVVTSISSAPLGNLVLAKQNLDGVRAEARMVIALAGLILMAGMTVMIVMAVGWLHDTAW